MCSALHLLYTWSVQCYYYDGIFHLFFAGKSKFSQYIINMRWLQELEDLFQIKIDKEQYQVITDEHLCLQVIAGAGSGKTFTICCKVYYLVCVKKVPAYKIVVLSYTNYACSEIQNYFKKMNLKIEVMTFHKFALNILKLNHISYHIETDVKRIIVPFIEELRTNDRNYYEDLILSYRATNYLKKRLLKYCYHILWKIKKEDIPNWLESSILHDLQNTDHSTLTVKLEQYKQNNHILFFSDMVSTAFDLLTKKDAILKDYSYLFIDEFQDISKERFEFIYQFHQLTNCHIIVVGDDYQSIYQFADSDVYYFVHFLDYYEHSNQIFLNHTYRNSQELLEYAKQVILRNQNQIHKVLYSDKHLTMPIQSYYYSDNRSYVRSLVQILKLIFEEKQAKKVLILSRYQFDLEIVKEKQVNQLLRKCPSEIKIDMLTIHKAKGLGYDVVIFLNLRQGKYGFPSTEMEIDLEEERRLFYVALTRTKSYVYLLIPKKNPSIFVEELLTLK